MPCVNMEEEITELKKVLRSIVVSSPSRVDLRSLLKDYREMIGAYLPATKFGYRTPLEFLQDNFQDCFLFHGDSRNPTLTLIVPETLKHIDNLVSKQRLTTKAKLFGRRKTILPSQQNATQKAKEFPSSENTYSLPRLPRLPFRVHNLDEPLYKTSSRLQVQDRNSSSAFSHTAGNDIEEQLNNLLEEHSEGICLNQLTTLYQRRYGQELHYQPWGDSLIDLLQKFPHVVRLERCRDEWMLYSAKSEPVVIQRPSISSAVPCSRQPITHSDVERFPEDCMQYEDSLPSDSIPVKVGDDLRLLVVVVYSPWEIWIRRAGREHQLRLIELISDMTVYYSKGGGRNRRLQLKSASVGQFCAAFSNGYWYRAFIVKVDSTDIVMVRLIDTGSVECVVATSLAPLLSQWSALPPQAVRARLAGVQPAQCDAAWPATASQALLELVQTREVAATVLDINAERNILELDLIDNNAQCCKHINEQLIIGGHARPHWSFCNARPKTETTSDSSSHSDVSYSQETHSPEKKESEILVSPTTTPKLSSRMALYLKMRDRGLLKSS